MRLQVNLRDGPSRGAWIVDVDHSTPRQVQPETVIAYNHLLSPNSEERASFVIWKSVVLNQIPFLGVLCSITFELHFQSNNRVVESNSQEISAPVALNT